MLTLHPSFRNEFLLSLPLFSLDWFCLLSLVPSHPEVTVGLSRSRSPLVPCLGVCVEIWSLEKDLTWRWTQGYSQGSGRKHNGVLGIRVGTGVLLKNPSIKLPIYWCFAIINHFLSTDSVHRKILGLELRGLGLDPHSVTSLYDWGRVHSLLWVCCLVNKAKEIAVSTRGVVTRGSWVACVQAPDGDPVSACRIRIWISGGVTYLPQKTPYQSVSIIFLGRLEKRTTK